MSNKLELSWIGKENSVNVEPRILIEKEELSNIGMDKQTENMLIHGDNLLALKALENNYRGSIKCVYIDPPYNSQNAFEQYDDNLEHSQWLSLMKPRLEIIRNLLKEDGSLWISIDDDEQAYLKVLCDEIFGRNNFVANVIWEKKYSPQNDAKWLSDSHDFIMVYAKNKVIWRPNLLPRTEEMNKRYKNPDNDPRGPWKPADFSAKTFSESGNYPITLPSGRVVTPPSSRSWITNETRFLEMVKDNRIWFGTKGDSVPSQKKFLSEVKQGTTAMTIWKYTEVGHNQDAKKEVKVFNPDNPFATPKPEKLIERILTLASNEGDIVLDSFLGSGTTAAVAHKMNRKYIGIEMGEHAYTHCKVRLDKVIEGEQGGISKAWNWNGGGGYRFYELAPSLIEKDIFDQEIINKEYDANMLAEAVAIHEGFIFEPDNEVFWKQSKANEHSYLFVTTRHLTVDYVDSIKNSMEEDDYLVIACKSFDSNVKDIDKRICVKKIPQMLLKKCEYGIDNYNLNIHENSEFIGEDN